jgi:ParB family chromosome partitioning protein
MVQKLILLWLESLLERLNMSEENKILNKGLDALLGSNSSIKQRSVKEIELSSISAGRFQPRSNFNEQKLSELTDSIKNHGVLSPILVRELGLNKFEVIAGERRLRASKQAGLETIPCLIDQKKDQDALESALIENLQREDLNAVEEARGYDRLKREFGLTQEEVAKSTGKARSTIANSLRLLSLPTSILEMLALGQIEKGHAKILASMDAKEALKTAQTILKNNLSVKDLNLGSNQKNSSKKTIKKQKDTDLLNIEQEMSESFGHKVEIDAKNKKSGRITISYSTSDELENIISKLSN